MPTLESLRRKIDTASDLSSVVTTMKTLAAVSIRQYEDAVEALADYNRSIELGFQIVLRVQPFHVEPGETPRRTGAVVFGSDQGMCGQFNEEIVAFLRDRQQAAETQEGWRLVVIGARPEGQLRDAGQRIDKTYEVPTSLTDVNGLVQELLPRIERWRHESDIGELLVFYNRRTSASSYEPQQLALLPIDPQRLRRWQEQPWQSRCLPTFALPAERQLSHLVRQYLFVSLFRACAESLASENAARIAAMQAAEKNIEERLDELNGAFNKKRQSAITEELLDVVTGFEALGGIS
jgi:F-type H+-transporting ATPase subunit gamma